MLAFVVRRLFFAAVALVAVAAIDYGMFDLPHGLERVFFHLDFGVACSYPGCPPVTVLLGRMWHTDVYLLLGGLVLGVTTGLSAAVFCATRPRSLATRAVETVAVIFYSMPVYLFGFGLLLLFEPTFGLLPSPVFFDPEDYAAPLENPWQFFEAMLVPWILVEFVFFIPGFFGLSRRAFGQAESALIAHEPLGTAYIPMVQGLALWAALLIVLVSALADVVLVMLDPRVRSTGRPVG